MPQHALLTRRQARWIAGLGGVVLFFGCLSGSVAWFIASLVVTAVILAVLVANDLRRWRND